MGVFATQAHAMIREAHDLVMGTMEEVREQQEKIIASQDERIVGYELRDAFGRSEVTPLGYGPPTPYTRRLVEQGVITLEEVDAVHWRARLVKR